MRRVVLGALALVGLAAMGATPEVNCWESGNTIVCSNGQTFTRLDGSVIDDRGRVWQEYGDRGQRQIYDPGGAAQRYGSIIQGPGGETCLRFGTQLFCTPAP